MSRHRVDLVEALRLVVAGAIGTALWLCAAAAAGQPLPPPTQDDPREQIPLLWQPSFGVTSLGYDSNVFNLPGGQKNGDWVASLAAGLAPIWHVGDVRIAAD